MVQLVTDDRVVGCEKCLEQSAVGIEAGGIQYRIIRSEEIRDLLFQLLMYILRTTDKTYRSNAVSFIVICLFGRLYKTRAVPKSEVVVRAHTEKFSSVLHCYSGTLWGNKRRLSFKKSRLFYSFHFFCVNT